MWYGIVFIILFVCHISLTTWNWIDLKSESKEVNRMVK